ncbi:MAG: TPM domain-containing protein [Elusimicrobia bacterium]|jgi:uncharacterized membrane protein|nr:TPM domain-containing protein [Elusimicrobiota bacterium]
MVNTYDLKRWAQHVFSLPGLLRRRFPAPLLKSIEEAVGNSEKKHNGEIQFAVEAFLPLRDLVAGVSPRERAEEIFSNLRVWNTENNNGVLIYINLSDRDVEIVADRGLNKKISIAEWETICRSMENHFREGRFEKGALAGIEGVTQLLSRHFPSQGDNPNELSDRPTLL